MQRKKHTAANVPILLGQSPVSTNANVKSEPESDTTKFTNNYLALADKALHKGEEKDINQSRSGRNARLRLEPQDGTPAKDYRIQDGEVEVRSMPIAATSTASQWQRLTSAEIAHHVEKNTIVARWLEARLGWRAVLKKCVQAPENERRAA